MNEQIMKILPEKVRCHKELMVGCGGCIRNLTIDDCAAAIEKANLVRCPTEEGIKSAVIESVKELYYPDGKTKYQLYLSNTELDAISKALLALLRGEK